MKTFTVAVRALHEKFPGYEQIEYDRQRILYNKTTHCQTEFTYSSRVSLGGVPPIVSEVSSPDEGRPRYYSKLWNSTITPHYLNFYPLIHRLHCNQLIPGEKVRAFNKIIREDYSM